MSSSQRLNSVQDLVTAIKQKLSCEGCGLDMKEIFHGDKCSHKFCRECFYSINLPIGRCMACSAPVASAVSSPLLTGVARSFVHFSSACADELESLPLFMTQDEPQPVGSFPRDQRTLPKVAPVPSSPVRTEGTMSSLTFPPVSDQVWATVPDSQQWQSSRVDDAEPLSTTKPASVRFESSVAAAAAAAAPESVFSSSHFPEASPPSSSFFTQSSQLQRMMNEIKAVQRNILQALDDAAVSDSPSHHTSHSIIPAPSLSSQNEIPIENRSVHGGAFVDEEEATVWEPPQNSGEEVISRPELSSQFHDEEDEDSHVSRDLLHDTVPPHPLPVVHEPSRATSHALHRAATTSSATFEEVQLSQHKEQRIVVSAVYSTEEHRQLYHTALQRGWIHTAPALSADNLTMQHVLVVELASSQSNHLHGGAQARLTYRSIQYMMALLAGMWIVGYRWLQDSVVEGRLQDLSGYEVGGTVYDRYLRAPLRSRFLPRQQGRLTLLQEYSFSVIFPQVRKGGVVSVEEVVELITLAGGKIISSGPPCLLRSGSSKTLPLCLTLKPPQPPLSPPPHQQGSEYYAQLAVSVSWLFDAICHLRLPTDLHDYLCPR